MEGVLAMTKNYEIGNNYEVDYQTPSDGYSYFFGYYDKSPLNRNNDKLLAHRVSFDGREVRDGDLAEVGYIDLKTGVFVKLDETLAWNWQQGSQLQWLPPENDGHIIYNSIESGKFVAVICNIYNKKRRILPYPIYTVHPNGKEAIGVNFERHYWCRPGYNYQNIKKRDWNKPYHERDGLRRIDLVTGESELIVSTHELVENKGLDECKRFNHWLEHVAYNPSGSRILFFHRWNDNGKDMSRVYTADSFTGQDLFMLPDNRFYSHYCWKDENTITIWTLFKNNEQKLTSVVAHSAKRYSWMVKILRPIYHLFLRTVADTFQYDIVPRSRLYNIVDKSGDASLVGSGRLKGNGHQSWFSDRTCLLNDTYQDTYCYRHLMIYNIIEDTIEKVGKFYSYYNDTTFRCDLHPRLSADNNFIVIDSSHEKIRSMIVLRKTDALKKDRKTFG
ncbi:hypothetical protein LG325_00895 [Marinobacter nauticus]